MNNDTEPTLTTSDLIWICAVLIVVVGIVASVLYFIAWGIK